ncbi:Ring hydroxylating dioxygenase, alpha-subunit [Granulibacter bethesdensis]|uniref:aromatic ring-hydroxylating oxygenase subunit alpha n=1 Tax=Granulibacter bethesdensis TaxID=364410 RepID=UPI00090C49B6|nr:aromatic ring-hydroxylating dioxygenase subunit alpha [Granulibacter bethesdensis]APH55846.1 Ring hydroxylating dioxygenase, alpha-subunit [Granulibacter bethesdensis]
MPDDLRFTPDSLPSLLARRKPGYTLEAPFYTSPDILDADIETIFGKHWIYVGVEPDIAEPGDVMALQIGRFSAIVVRGDDMEIRAFHNVCRHRGARIVPEGKRSVGNLVCPYHMWTYSTEGPLLHADHMGADFDPSCHGLKPVHVRNVAGLIFLCFADEPPADIEDMAREMTPYLTPHAIPDTKIAFEMDIIERGNWKLVMENNRECYHCAGSHPELTASIFEFGFGFAPESLDEDGQKAAEEYNCLVNNNTAEWEARGLPSREIDHLDDRVTGFRTQRLPISGAGESETPDTKVACTKLLGELTERKLGALSFWTQPNSWHHFMSDHIVTFAVFPIDAETALLRTKWLVHKDAREGIDYDLDHLKSVWEATNQQDSDLVGITQQGVRTPAYQPGPYSPYTEMLVEKFSNWYISRMKAAQQDGAQ